MKALSQLYRLLHINFVLAKHGLDEVLLATRLFAPLRFLVYLNPWTWIRDKGKPRGVRIRHSLEELGPIFVKFGQMLSTRPDLIPDDIATELTLLQDKVPPFSGAKHLVESLYRRPLPEIFSEFEEQPLASASIAQVHAATLLDGEKVVVKVLRPGIKKIIKRDIALLYTIAKLTERYLPEAKRLKPREIVAEFEHTLLNELDLMREASNASILRRNFKNSSLLYVPKINWPFCREKVIVMERIYGIPVADVAQLKTHDVDMKALAERGVEIFFTQVFRDCFFHADMHPGNIFVSASNPREPMYIAVDFGIMGSLSSLDQRYLAENLLAFFKRDYRRVAQLHIDSGWVPADTRVEEFEAAIRTVCEPIFERPLKDISFGQLLLRLFQTGKQFNMEIQPQLLLLQKTLLHIEGLGRQLYPELDLWETAKPHIEKWLKGKAGPRALVQKLGENFPSWIEKLPEIPGLVYNSLQHMQMQEIRATTQPPKASKIVASENGESGFLTGMVFALLLSALICLGFGTGLWGQQFSVLNLGLTFLVASIGLFIVNGIKRN